MSTIQKVMKAAEQHCILCGYGNPTKEQMEKFMRGEYVGFVHIKHVVELSARTTDVLSSPRARTPVAMKQRDDSEEVLTKQLLWATSVRNNDGGYTLDVAQVRRWSGGGRLNESGHANPDHIWYGSAALCRNIPRGKGPGIHPIRLTVTAEEAVSINVPSIHHHGLSHNIHITCWRRFVTLAELIKAGGV